MKLENILIVNYLGGIVKLGLKREKVGRLF